MPHSWKIPGDQDKSSRKENVSWDVSIPNIHSNPNRCLILHTPLFSPVTRPKNPHLAQSSNPTYLKTAVHALCPPFTRAKRQACWIELAYRSSWLLSLLSCASVYRLVPEHAVWAVSTLYDPVSTLYDLLPSSKSALMHWTTLGGG